MTEELNTKPILYIDSREGIKGNSKKIVTALKNKEDFVCKVTNLGDAVDFLIPTANGTIGIQRKKVTEMGGKASLADITAMLLMDNCKPYLLLEGNWDSLDYTKYAKNMIVKRLYQICMDLNVGILPSGDRHFTVKWLEQITKNYGVCHEVDLEVFRGGLASKLSSEKAALYILTGFPGISKTLGDRLLTEYVTLENTLNNIENWKGLIEGVGKHKMNDALRIYRAKYIKEMG